MLNKQYVKVHVVGCCADVNVKFTLTNLDENRVKIMLKIQLKTRSTIMLKSSCEKKKTG